MYPRGAFPRAKGCGEKGKILLTYLSLVAYFGSVGGSPINRSFDEEARHWNTMSLFRRFATVR